MEKTSTDGAVFKAMGKLSKAITGISDKLEKIPGRAPEKIAMAIYAFGHMLMMLAHEPWFDEALAWMIAKDSSIYDILFEAPHYEGHPGLWHLILAPFARNGAPYELTLSIISLVFTGVAIYLFIWKAPFKRIIRILMPFSYFLFYQFGVVSRPYCMMLLAFVLMALAYEKRNEHPLRYVSTLLFLCATSAYGIVIAGGLAIVWLIEMWQGKGSSQLSGHEQKRGFKTLINGLFEKKKIIWLFLLLIYALFLMWRIIPRENTAAYTVIESEPNNGIIVRLLFTFFSVLSDLFLTNVFYEQGALREVEIMYPELVMSIFIGAAILTAIIIYGLKKRRLLSFILPYSLYAVFSAFVYLYKHHVGVVLLFLGFWLWICAQEKNEDIKILEKIQKIPSYVKDLGVIICAIFILIPLYWSVASCIVDVATPYSFGREEYEYLVENDLLDCTIMGEWGTVAIATSEDYDINDVTSSLHVTCIQPYWGDDNILNRPSELNLSYAYFHEVPTPEENEKAISVIYGKNTPDILIGSPNLSDIYRGEELNMADYVLVREKPFGLIWKGLPGGAVSHIYVKKEIAEAKGLVPEIIK